MIKQSSVPRQLVPVYPQGLARADHGKSLQQSETSLEDAARHLESFEKIRPLLIWVLLTCIFSFDWKSVRGVTLLGFSSEKSKQCRAELNFVQNCCQSVSLKEKQQKQNILKKEMFSKLFQCLKSTFKRTHVALSSLHLPCSFLYWPGREEWTWGDPTALPDWNRAANTSHSDWLSLTSNACLFYSSVTSDPDNPSHPPSPTPISPLKRGSTKSLFKSHRTGASFA